MAEWRIDLVATADMFLTQNPHNANQDIWRVVGNTRRQIQLDEYNFYHGFLGEGVLAIPANWFDTIPVATG